MFIKGRKKMTMISLLLIFSPFFVSEAQNLPGNGNYNGNSYADVGRTAEENSYGGGDKTSGGKLYGAGDETSGTTLYRGGGLKEYSYGGNLKDSATIEDNSKGNPAMFGKSGDSQGNSGEEESIERNSGGENKSYERNSVGSERGVGENSGGLGENPGGLGDNPGGLERTLGGDDGERGSVVNLGGNEERSSDGSRINEDHDRSWKVGHGSQSEEYHKGRHRTERSYGTYYRGGRRGGYGRSYRGGYGSSYRRGRGRGRSYWKGYYKGYYRG